MVGPVVHGPAVESSIMLIGQAPGPREGQFGHPFAWTAGKTLFRWFQESLGVDEKTFRERVYIAAVGRCFPGKAKGGGDRKPDKNEIAACRTYLERETTILQPSLLIPVGGLAIEQVLTPNAPAQKLAAVVGKKITTTYHGVETDVIALPHPSGASTWHQMEPGKILLQQALALLAKHPTLRTTFR